MKTHNDLRPEDGPIGSAAIRWFEHGLLALAVAALAAALWIMLDRDRPVAAIIYSSVEVTEALPRWSHAPPLQVHMRLDALPDARSREWLVALQRTGTDISWETAPGSVWQPTGIAVEPLADPRRPLRVWAATQGESPGAIVETAGGATSSTDSAGARTVAMLPSGTGVVNLRSLAGAVAIEHDRGGAGATLRDALGLKPVLLLGRASWEARFVTAALEEHGWEVDARLLISPAQVVGETPRAARPDGKAPRAVAGRGGGRGGGGPGGRSPEGRGPESGGSGGGPGAAGAVARPAGPGDAVPAVRDELTIDIEHYAAVIVLDDSAAAHAPAIAAFIDEGGGAVVLGHGAIIPALRELLPAAASGSVQEARGFAADEPVPDGTAGGAALEDTAFGPRDHLELRPLLQLRSDAHAVERRGDDIAVAIHRNGKGRVLQAGYADTWRWRMASPDENAPEASREWLAGLLSMVAHARRSDMVIDAAALTSHDPAPVAAWHAAFGAPGSAPSGAGARDWSRLNWLTALFTLAALALLSQWFSRRLRGGG